MIVFSDEIRPKISVKIGIVMIALGADSQGCDTIKKCKPGKLKNENWPQKTGIYDKRQIAAI